MSKSLIKTILKTTRPDKSSVTLYLTIEHYRKLKEYCASASVPLSGVVDALIGDFLQSNAPANKHAD
jgi:hypothetical protein